MQKVLEYNELDSSGDSDVCPYPLLQWNTSHTVPEYSTHCALWEWVWDPRCTRTFKTLNIGNRTTQHSRILPTSFHLSAHKSPEISLSGPYWKPLAGLLAALLAQWLLPVTQGWAGSSAPEWGIAGLALDAPYVLSVFEKPAGAAVSNP